MAPEVARALEFHAVAPLREREYPLAGCDAHGAMADDAGSYVAHDPEPVATEAPNAIAYDDEGHPIEREAAPAATATDDEGHPIEAEAEAAKAAPIDTEASPEPAASVAVATPASAQESAAS
jgi:sec-independent protein translocase protein TatB